MENPDRNQIDEPMNDGEGGRIDRAREKTRETIDRAKDRLAAGAATATETGRNAASGAKQKASRAAEFVRDAETDTELKGNVTTRTERGLDRAGDALTRAAPTIGRGTEMAAAKVGQALHAISHPTAMILGTIAGTLGGWWRKAADERMDLPESEEQACRDHFSTIAAMPPGMTYERARPAYAIGYVASRNPAYRGRQFEELDAELRRGFGEGASTDYDSLRDFARFGYERGAGA